MKTKNGNVSSKNDKSIGLNILIEKYVNVIKLSGEENKSEIDKTVHDVRKSLKTILAILLLYKNPFDLTQYLHWKAHFRSILKEFAVSRESYVFIQTLCFIESKIEGFDKSYFDNLRKDLDSKYILFVMENENLKLNIKELSGTINSITQDLNNSFRNLDIKLIKDNHNYTLQMTQRLFKRLSLSSSSEDFHKFRKWCIFYHLQHTALIDIGLKKISSENEPKYHKLTEYLGKEHDLYIFFEYLKTNYTNMSMKLSPFYLLNIKRLRKKALLLYPKIFS